MTGTAEPRKDARVTITDPRGLVTALLEVPGVASAAVEPDPDGPGTLRLQLALGADEVDG